MSNAKKQKRLELIIFGAVLTGVGFLVHDYLAKVLNIFPNSGISFGWSCELLVVMAILALMVILFLSLRQGNFGLMIVGVGGLINFIDRMIFGYVRDYWNWGWFYNNLADWIIVFGVVYSGWILWKKK